MKKIVPVLLLVIAVLVTLYVLLSTDEPDQLLPSGKPPAELEFCAVEGQVLDRDGNAFPGVRVRARILDAGPSFSVEAGTTDEAGRFAARLFPARGAWEIEARPPGDSPFHGEVPVLAQAGETIETVLRQPPRQVAEPPEPNLGGEVSDSSGRTLTGITVLVYDSSDAVIARIVSGERGVFETHVTAVPPLKIGIEGDDYRTVVDPLPDLSVRLYKNTLHPGKAELEVRADLISHADEQIVIVELWDSVGQMEVSCDWWLGRGPWTFLNVPFGAYDVRIRGKTVAGVLQGFDFRAENRIARVSVGQCAQVRGRLSRSAEVTVFSRSPTRVPLDSATLETFGSRRTLRGNVAGTEGRAKKFDFGGLAAGNYLLRCTGLGVETKKIELELKAGQTLDLGLLDLEPAKGAVSITVDEGRKPAEFAYRVILYTHDGLSMRETVPATRDTAVFTDLPAGIWHYRVSRYLSKGHLRTVGNDRRFELKAGEKKELEEDCSWRY